MKMIRALFAYSAKHGETISRAFVLFMTFWILVVMVTVLMEGR